MNEQHPIGAATCPSCDDDRRRWRRGNDIGKPCDICAGRGFDYIGRPCRHALGNPR